MGSIERLLLYYNYKGMLKNKESGEPDSRAGARSLQRPYFLSAECASSRRVFISQDELSCEIKKNLHTGP